VRDELIVATKVAVSACVIYAIGRRVELGQMVASLHQANFFHLGVAVVLAVLAVPVVSVRWRMLAAMFTVRLSTGMATQATFAGLFVGQVLPGAIGADVVRGWMIWHQGLPNKMVIASLVADRIISLAAVGLMILAALPALMPYLPEAIVALIKLGLLGGLLILLVAFVAVRLLNSPRVKSWQQAARRRLSEAGVRLSRKTLVVSLLLATLGHGLVILSAYFLSVAMKVDSSLWMWLLVMPIVTLVTAIPISINGWGVRELAMVQLWALFGVSRSDAFLISICMGLVAIVSSLPGLWFWLTKRRNLQSASA
jgi:uncharacterized membrane protein YbhN (UPF0104 family)